MRIIEWIDKIMLNRVFILPVDQLESIAPRPIRERPLNENLPQQGRRRHYFRRYFLHRPPR